MDSIEVVFSKDYPRPYIKSTAVVGVCMFSGKVPLEFDHITQRFINGCTGTNRYACMICYCKKLTHDVFAEEDSSANASTITFGDEDDLTLDQIDIVIQQNLEREAEERRTDYEYLDTCHKKSDFWSNLWYDVSISLFMYL